MTRRSHPVVAFLLALLLVTMQQGALLHALEHDNGRLHRSQDTGLQGPAIDVSCAMCALFAGGANATPAVAAALSAPVEDFSPFRRATAPAAVASPSPYQSRAPPPIL